MEILLILAARDPALLSYGLHREFWAGRVCAVLSADLARPWNMDDAQSRTDFGKPGYGGPCPLAGDKPHRYQFTVYDLKTDKLPLDENAPAAMVGFYLNQSLLANAVLRATFGR